ncbi:MAG: hypothetical protein AAB702_01115 [Patescibacteria group bacterium]
MFTRKRQLKKEKIKKRTKTAFIVLFFLSIILIFIEYLYLNFSFGKTFYISPVSQNKTSKTIALEKELEKSNILFKRVSVSSDRSLLIELADGGIVIMSPKKDIKNQISSLQLVLSKLTIEGKKLKSLDFRFNNPVISY